MCMIDFNMASGTIRPKGKELFERFGQHVTLYRVAKNADISHTTVHRWKKQSEIIRQIDGEVFFGILIDGFGLTVEEVKNLTLGEIFEFVVFDEEGSAE